MSRPADLVVRSTRGHQSTKQNKSFHELMAEERSRRRLDPRRLAKFATVPKEQYEAWERGEGLPTIDQCGKMFGQSQVLLNALRHAQQTKPEAAATPSVAGDAPTSTSSSKPANHAATKSGQHERVEDPPQDPHSHVPKSGETASNEPLPNQDGPVESFGTSLFTARRAAKLSQARLAERVGVKECTIRTWEGGGALPSEQNYDAIMIVLPSLASFPRPEALAKGRPGRPAKDAGSTRAEVAKEATADERENAQLNADRLTPIDTLDAFDDVINAYELLGITVVSKFERRDGLRVASLIDATTNTCIVESAGTTTADAAQRALISLGSTLFNQMKEARAEIEAATKKLAMLQTAHASVAAIVERKASA